jgi:hypothetical protein
MKIFFHMALQVTGTVAVDTEAGTITGVEAGVVNPFIVMLTADATPAEAKELGNDKAYQRMAMAKLLRDATEEADARLAELGGVIVKELTEVKKGEVN